MNAATTAARPTPTDVPELAVVIPVLNEAAAIAQLLGEVEKALSGMTSFEIVAVNDGSTDTTGKILAKLSADTPHIVTVTHRVRCGQSAAIDTGVRKARASVIATIDGDGQNDPADIPVLYAAFRSAPNPDRILIAGHRTRRKDTAIKRLSSKIANGVRRRLLGDQTPDTGCGLKVFSRAAFLDMPRFNHMHRFLPALMRRRGGEVRSIPVNHRPRDGGTSNYGVWDRLWVGIVDLFGVIWLIRRNLPPDREHESYPETDTRHLHP